MSQNISKRRDDIGRDLLWHTHCVTTRMECKAYKSVQMCKFYKFQNITQFIREWGGREISVLCMSGQEILTNVQLNQRNLQGQGHVWLL